MYTCKFCGKPQKENDIGCVYSFMLKIRFESPCINQVYEAHLCEECALKMRVPVGTFFNQLELYREEFSKERIKGEIK